MAWFPCDQHGAPYKGAQQTAYPALVNGAVSKRVRRRLCPSCFATLKEWVEVNLAPASLPGEQLDLCVGECGSEENLVFAVFVTLYETGEERADWYGRCCRPCAESDVGLALFGETGELR